MIEANKKALEMVRRISEVLDRKGFEYRVISNEDLDGYLILCNWNQFTMPKYDSIRNVMEEHDIEHAYPDEYEPCTECGRACRVKADSANFQPEFVADDEHTILCRECFEQELESYGNDAPMIREYNAHPEHVMLPHWAKPLLIKLGWKVYDTYKTGIQFPLTSARPDRIERELLDKGIFDYIFVAEWCGPFKSTFNVLIKS